MNLERIKQKARTLQWEEMYQSKDINVINHIFERNVLSILDAEAPMRKIQVRKNYGKWISDELKLKISERDTQRESARISGRRGGMDKIQENQE